jgi:hypothetical protein
MVTWLSRWRCWRVAITYPRVNMDGALEGAPRHTPSVLPDISHRGRACAWSPSPLWGGVGEGDFAPHKNPARLPDTLPTRGRVRDDAPPRIPFVTPLEGEMSGRAEGGASPHTRPRPDPTPHFAQDLPSNPPHITRSSQSIAWSLLVNRECMSFVGPKPHFEAPFRVRRPPRSHEVAPAPPRRQVAENAGLRHR